MVHGHDLDAGGFLDHRFEEWTGRFDQMGSYLLQQVSSLFGGKLLDQVLFGCGQNPRKADDQEIAKQVGVDVLWASAHVILLEATNSLADGGFDLSLGSHGGVHYSQSMDFREPNAM